MKGAICQACVHYPGRVGKVCRRAMRHATSTAKDCSEYALARRDVLAVREVAQAEHRKGSASTYARLLTAAHRLSEVEA